MIVVALRQVVWESSNNSDSCLLKRERGEKAITTSIRSIIIYTICITNTQLQYDTTVRSFLGVVITVYITTTGLHRSVKYRIIFCSLCHILAPCYHQNNAALTDIQSDGTWTARDVIGPAGKSLWVPRQLTLSTIIGLGIDDV
jgi:hypothetical protein